MAHLQVVDHRAMPLDPRTDPGPLIARFPSLAQLPRRLLGDFPTPLEEVIAPSGARLWLKRDDRSSAHVGGNKVRALEFLLGDIGRGNTVVTIGGVGSTHVLATAVHAAVLGARTIAFVWPHEMNDAARATARQARDAGAALRPTSNAVTALARAALVVLRGKPGERRPRWIPAGGTSAIGALGHVGAALEFVAQADARALPRELTVVVPLGSGGTAAGLALGFAIAGRPISVVGVRVVTRLVANVHRLRAVAGRTARLIERHSGERIPRPLRRRVIVDHSEFGGAYGRETIRGREAALWAESHCALLTDATYSAKALAAALRWAEGGPTVFWMTYDGRAATTLPPR
ncbi:MAG: pyridoxal-phosphate dependent enzyme [Gemmatimonadaceae bacterium]